MRILSLEQEPFHTLPYRSSGPRGTIRNGTLPFYRAHADGIPDDVSAIVAVSDLQGREVAGRNRLLGELVAEELQLLSDFGEIPELCIAIIAGDLFDYPDCRKLGGTGDVTPAWQAFSSNFDVVVGVLGNHDIIDTGALSDNVEVLDGRSVRRLGMRVGGVSGIIGRKDRNQRKEKAEYMALLTQALKKHDDIVVLHQGPDDPVNGQIGEPVIRGVLEKQGETLVIFGHCFWATPLVQQGENQLLNVDSRVVVLTQVPVDA